MFRRSQTCVALIFCTAVAFAQEALTPPADSTAQPGAGASASGAAPAAGSAVVSDTPRAAAVPEEGGGFSLPGGMGYAPLNFTPGQGKFDRKPLSFSTTVQVGYDDNVYNSAGNSPFLSPKQGSMLTTASEGVDLLLAQSRVGLSLGANLGGQYYWDRATDKLTPNGSLNLVFGYKLTPRAQLTALINAMYTTQPSMSVINGLANSGGKGYLIESSKFDLLYSWAPRFSTDTYYSANVLSQQATELQSGNYINQTFGQSLRYSFSRLVTGVFEGRYSDLSYGNTPAFLPSRDSSTYFVLAGCDVTLSRRFAGTFRVGATTREYSAPGESSSTAPYGEFSLNYLITKYNTLNWDGRYGYDDGTASSPRSKSARTGLTLAHAFTSKLRGTLGANYNHIDSSNSGLGSSNSGNEDGIDTTVGATYQLAQNFTVFANVTHTRRISPDPFQEFTKNVYYLGVTLEY